jgi:hypothetical protein
VLKITRIGDVMRSNTELIDMSDAQMQREIYPLYIVHDNENIKSCWISALWHFVTPRRTGDVEV